MIFTSFFFSWFKIWIQEMGRRNKNKNRSSNQSQQPPTSSSNGAANHQVGNHKKRKIDEAIKNQQQQQPPQKVQDAVAHEGSNNQQKRRKRGKGKSNVANPTETPVPQQQQKKKQQQISVPKKQNQTFFETPNDCLQYLLGNKVSIQTFVEEYWEKKPLHVKRSDRSAPDHHKTLFSLKHLQEILGSGDKEINHGEHLNLCIYEDGEKQNANLSGKRPPLLFPFLNIWYLLNQALWTWNSGCKQEGPRWKKWWSSIATASLYSSISHSRFPSHISSFSLSLFSSSERAILLVWLTTSLLAQYSDVMHKMMAGLEEYFGCLVGANVYITPPSAQGLGNSSSMQHLENNVDIH